jgi:hypothetical protein
MSLDDTALIRLFSDVEEGALPIGEALRQATASPGIGDELDDDALRELTNIALEQAKTEAWRSAVRLSLLVSSALAANQPRYAARAPFLTARWIDTLGKGLWHVADPRMYERALALANAVEPDLIRSRNGRLLADIYFALGILHLDPVAADRGNNPGAMWRNWIARDDTWDTSPIHQLDRSAILNFPRMIQKAQVYLRASARCYGNSPGRGLAMKAFAQAVGFRPHVDLPARHRTVKRAATDAIKHLTGSRHAPQLAEAQHFMLRAVEALGETAPAVASPQGVEQAMGVEQPGRARYLANLVALEAETDPEGALASLLAVYPTIVDDEDEAVKLELLELQARLLIELERLERLDAPAWTAELQAVVLALRTPPAPDDAGATRRLVARAVNVAASSIPLDRERDAAQLLLALREAVPDASNRHVQVVQWLQGILESNCGGMAFKRQAFDESAASYARAVAARLGAGLAGMAFEAVRLLSDAAQHLTPEGAADVSRQVGRMADALRVLLPRAASGMLVELHERLHQARGGRISPDLTLLMWSLAKGRTFACALAAGGPSIQRSARLDAAHERLDEGAPEAASLFVRDLLGEVGQVFEELLLLSPYSERQVELTGDTPASRRAHLQLSYEGHFWDAVRMLPVDYGSLCTTQDLARSIPADTAVLVQYVVHKEALDVVYQLLWSHHGVEYVGIQLPPLEMDGVSGAQVGPLHLRFRQLASALALCRSALREPAEPGQPCSTAARASLDRFSQWLLHPLAPALGRLRAAGVRHLVVVPHGALHFLPFHLLSVEGQPLAAQWLVTGAPNLGCLAAPAPQVAADGGASTAIGLGFGHDPRGLSPLPEALSEARTVARVTGGAVLHDEDGSATKANVLEALRTSRRVHIASHGLHNPIAPMFQCLYVAPDAEAPLGELYAHELAQCDLRHLELVTLSACETALGRVDEADNLMGLPAALFMAGVPTIVGTLWDVSSAAATRFFETFYGAMGEGSAVFAAFATAQREVRAVHPELRDWGAFQMISVRPGSA